MPRQGPGFPRERDKHLLGDIFRQMPVTTDAPQRRRIHRIDMPPDQFGKRVPGPSLSVTAKQRSIVQHDRTMAAAAPETEQRIRSERHYLWR